MTYTSLPREPHRRSGMTAYVGMHPTARKRHWCDVCRWPIMPGERYLRAVSFDGTAVTWRECLWCERVRARLLRRRVPS